MKSLELRDFNALVDQMVADMEAEKAETKRMQRGGRSGRPATGSGERRTPVMT